MGAALGAGMFAPADARAGDAETLIAATMMEAAPFQASRIVDLARALSALPFEQPDDALPPQFDDLSYEAYIAIRSRAEAALFAQDGLAFRIEPLHRGFVFRQPVRLFVERDRRLSVLPYGGGLFVYPEGVAPAAGDISFSGFRILTRQGDAFIEEAVFQGATYFRAIAHNQSLGAMARGLSINTSEPGGEEFPFFRLFVIETPKGNTLTIHALADSESATAAFRMQFTPGQTAAIDIEATVFARRDIASLGMGGLQTTYFFGPNDRQGVDDLRVAAAENDALQIERGNGEWIYRPLANPSRLQLSAFGDSNPRGFGFLQRQRAFSAFEDDNQGFERRPTVFNRMIGDWGAGAVELIELPTRNDINDNIIAYWRPTEPLKAGQSRQFAYRQIWCDDLPEGPKGPIVTQSRSGAGSVEGARRFLVEFKGAVLKGLPRSALSYALSASEGVFVNQRIRHAPDQGVARLVFEIDGKGAETVELRAALSIAGGPPSETWLYRWAA